MTNNLGDMVAIAAGPAKQINQWVNCLRAAAIPYHLATATYTRVDELPGRTELWVANDDANEARKAIRSAEKPGRKLIW